jgi:hypothetical protein
MSYPGRLRAEMKGLSALLYFAIPCGYSFVLAQMVGPRFSHKAYDVSFGGPRCHEVSFSESHCRADVSASFLSLPGKLRNGFGIDSIFSKSDGRSLLRLCIDHDSMRDHKRADLGGTSRARA